MESSQERRLINYQRYLKSWDEYEKQVNDHFETRETIRGKKKNIQNLQSPNEKLKQLAQTINVDHFKPTISLAYFKSEDSSVDIGDQYDINSESSIESKRKKLKRRGTKNISKKNVIDETDEHFENEIGSPK